MRLTVQTDYALRLLMFLAQRQGELATIAEIAARYGISRNHLMKVAHVLARAGFVKSTRGRAGGLALARPADEIAIGAVARHLERDSALVECFRADGNACRITGACRLQGVLYRALEAFFAVLDDCTLADLVDDNDALGRLLKEHAA
ncbi:MAG: Rrf2 family transcriptional regulator [Alphaproteobacteria bacterium]